MVLIRSDQVQKCDKKLTAFICHATTRKRIMAVNRFAKQNIIRILVLFCEDFCLKSIVNLKSASLAEDPLSYKSIRVISLIGILLSFILFNLIWIKFLAKRRWDPNNGCLL